MSTTTQRQQDRTKAVTRTVAQLWGSLVHAVKVPTVPPDSYARTESLHGPQRVLVRPPMI